MKKVTLALTAKRMMDFVKFTTNIEPSQPFIKDGYKSEKNKNWLIVTLNKVDLRLDADEMYGECLAQDTLNGTNLWSQWATKNEDGTFTFAGNILLGFTKGKPTFQAIA